MIAFFERQQQMRRQTTRMLLLFAVAVLGTVLAVDALVWLFLHGMQARQVREVGTMINSQTALVIEVTTAVVLGIILVASAIRLRQLSDGGAAIALRLGGREVDFNPTDPAEQRLRNVVEEMAIASTVPVPRVFVLDHEASINAFAAGSSTDDSAIAVSAGALRHLDRDELQGVVAHEFSHILNGDMRLNGRLMALLFGLFAVTVAGRVLFQIGRSHGGRASLPIFLAGAVLMLVGAIGLLAGRLIQAAISRSREHLADASAVQFTRLPVGLAGALKKIAAHPQGARLQNPHGGEVAHMLFGDGVSRTHWLSTHPPLLDRIAALEPGFGPARLQAYVQRFRATAHADTEHADAAVEILATPGDASASLAPLAATPTPAISRLPIEWQSSVRDTDSALQVVQTLLASDSTRGGNALFDLPVNQQVNLALLALSRLWPLGAAQRDRLQSALQCSSANTIQGLCIRLLLARHLHAMQSPLQTKRRHLPECAQEIGELLSTLALAGHGHGDTARVAYLRAIQVALPQSAVPMRGGPARFDTLQSALWKLDQLDVSSKRLLTDAMQMAVLHDGICNIEEYALLRSFCTCLHCPMPALPEA